MARTQASGQGLPSISATTTRRRENLTASWASTIICPIGDLDGPFTLEAQS